MPCVSCASPLVPTFRRSPCTRAPNARRCSSARPTTPCASTPAPARSRRRSPYLDLAMLERALRSARVDAAWVGWGFVAERPEFAELCERLDIVFVGPRPDVMRKLGDKIAAKLLAEQAEVPVAAWSGGPVDTVEDATDHAERIGYPLMVKAAAGGGGRGIRRVDDSGTARRGVRERQVRGRQGVRRPDGLHRARRHRRPPRRGPTDRRPLRHGLGARRPRLQHAAAQPEGHRGVAMHRPHHSAGRRPACRRRAPGHSSPGTPTQEPSSFSTNRRTSASPSSRSTPAYRSSIPVTELTTGLDLVKLQLHVAAGGRLDGHGASDDRLRRRSPSQRRGSASRFRPGPGSHRLAHPAGRPGNPGRHGSRRR